MFFLLSVLLVSNVNLTFLILSFSFFLMYLLMIFFLNMNEKWIILILLIFLVGGMMIFISMISSTFKYNKIFKLNLIFSFLLLPFLYFPLKNLNSQISMKSVMLLMSNFSSVFMSLLIIMMVLIIKDMIYKKQKNMKI